MKQKRLLSKMIVLSLLLGSTGAVYAADADSFKTEEYNNIGANVLDTIHAAEAYAKGYTGAGVTVGVIDQPINFSNVEFSGKVNSFMADVVGDGTYNWSELDHGSHVAGTVAAAKNGVGMHGVAYDAEVIGTSFGADYTDPDDVIVSQNLFAYYLQTLLLVI